MWFVTNNIDSHSIEWELIMFINIRVLRLRSTDWKSSLKELHSRKSSSFDRFLHCFTGYFSLLFHAFFRNQLFSTKLSYTYNEPACNDSLFNRLQPCLQKSCHMAPTRPSQHPRVSQGVRVSYTGVWGGVEIT